MNKLYVAGSAIIRTSGRVNRTLTISELAFWPDGSLAAIATQVPIVQAIEQPAMVD